MIRPFVYVREKDLRTFAEKVRSHTFYRFQFQILINNKVHESFYMKMLKPILGMVLEVINSLCKIVSGI